MNNKLEIIIAATSLLACALGAVLNFSTGNISAGIWATACFFWVLSYIITL